MYVQVPPGVFRHRLFKILHYFVLSNCRVSHQCIFLYVVAQFLLIAQTILKISNHTFSKLKKSYLFMKKDCTFFFNAKRNLEVNFFVGSLTRWSSKDLFTCFLHGFLDLKIITDFSGEIRAVASHSLPLKNNSPP